jgi:hypothetical protein
MTEGIGGQVAAMASDERTAHGPTMTARRAARLLKACVICGRPTSPGPRCPDHAYVRDNGHARRKRLAARVLREELVCHLCGKVGTPDDPLTIDHLVPASQAVRPSERTSPHATGRATVGEGIPCRVLATTRAAAAQQE